jgi:hypothetical protein
MVQHGEEKKKLRVFKTLKNFLTIVSSNFDLEDSFATQHIPLYQIPAA